MSQKVIIQVSALFAILAWLVMAFADMSILFSFRNNIDSNISEQVPVIAFNFYLFCLFLYYKFKIERAENLNFIDLLWKVFVTGLVTTLISLFFNLLTLLIGESTLGEFEFFREFIYIINIGLLSALLLSCFAVFRRLILYQKSKFLITVWRIFQYALLLSLVYNVLPFTALDDIFNYYLIALVLMALFLSGNMKWVAYLNFKQKWKGILLVALLLFYLIYFTWWVGRHEITVTNAPFLDYGENVFFVALTAFVVIYTIFSLLVLLFNLPTSSVFEQKLEEVGNFQKLSQSIQTEHSEERVYDILLESSVSTVFADAAWLELYQNEKSSFYTFQIDEEEAIAIKEKFANSRVQGLIDQGQDKTKNLDKILRTVKGTRFRSLIAAPIVVKNQQIGTLALLKEVTDGFNKEMQKIVSTFANQAGISIENFRLLKEALENERYKEELKIAKRVQSSLLPTVVGQGTDFDIHAFSRAAAEVGGDYYDTYQVSSEKTALIIGDVSGKGTSAAFHMSQMKGIFQSLSRMALDPLKFMDLSNAAISECLDKTSFITATYFVINQKNNEIEFSRAGHCPTLFYSSEKKSSEYFSNKGMGLGLLRNNTFKNFIQKQKISYLPGDLLILYTDGITEAQNAKGDEYGYDRLQKMIDRHANKTVQEISELAIEDLYSFTGTENINDDYTLVIVKFK